jgi:hypothetical protein
MGAATSSTIFFRSIGSTVGVAASGSVMLTRYHRDFARTTPDPAPARRWCISRTRCCSSSQGYRI